MVLNALKRAFQSIKSLRSYRGSDLQGNKFYEVPNPNDVFGRTKRTVKYHENLAMWDYVGGTKRLPAQWAAWMSHTRKLAPTLEELQNDHNRLQRLAHNVAVIEERDRVERQHRLAGTEPTLGIETPRTVDTPRQDMKDSSLDAELADQPRVVEGARIEGAELGPRTIDPNLPPEKDPWANLPKPQSFSAESWAPRASVRRGGE